MLCVHDFQLLIDPLEDIIITVKPPSFNYCCGFFFGVLPSDLLTAQEEEHLRTNAVLTLSR